MPLAAARAAAGDSADGGADSLGHAPRWASSASRASAATRCADGDRIELYRPLEQATRARGAAPSAAARERAARSGG